MSSVLQASALPAMVNLQEWKAYIDSEIQKGIEKGIEKALPDAVEKALFSKNCVSIEDYNALKASYIDTVELLANAMKRITQLEKCYFST